MLEKIFDLPWSVTRAIAVDEKEWRSNNQYRKKYRSSFLRREWVFVNENPARFVLSILLLAVVSWIACWTLDFVAPLKNWSASEQLGYFSSLWSIQGTLAALVYPLVIAFVTIFLQKRPGANAFLRVYLTSSGALSSGLSSLTLVIVMGIHYALIPLVGTELLHSFVTIYATWFVLNAILTMVFLVLSLSFMRPVIQSSATKTHLLSVVMPAELRHAYATRAMNEANMRGWLPTFRNENVRLLIGSSTILRDAREYSFPLQAESYIKDVRLWILFAAVYLWAKPSRQNEYSIDNECSIALGLPLQIGKNYDNSLPLAKVLGKDLSRFQTRLLKLAYVVRRTSTINADASMSTMLKEIALDAKLALERPDLGTFDEAYRTLLHIHQLLISSTLDVDATGAPSSWALLEHRGGWFGTSWAEKWTQNYNDIFEAAVELLETHQAPVRRLFYIAHHLSSKELAAGPEQLQIQILNLPPTLIYFIRKWWARKIEVQGPLRPGPNNAMELPHPLSAIYDSTLREFFGAWDMSCPKLMRNPIDSNSWTKYGREVSGLVAHMENTAMMLLSAVQAGDARGAEWLADSLNCWWSGHTVNVPGFFARFADAITVDDLKLDWETLAQTFGFEKSAHYSALTIRNFQYASFVAAIHNYWQDIRILSAQICLSWHSDVPESTVPESLALRISVSILSGRTWNDIGIASAMSEAIGPQLLIKSLLRQYAGGISNRYANRWETFISTTSRLERAVVSGRVYTQNPINSVDALIVQQFVLLAGFSDGTRAPDIIVRENLKWYARDALTSQQVSQFLIDIKDAATSISISLEALMQTILRNHTGYGLQPTEVIAITHEYLIALRNRFEETLNSIISSTSISEVRLEQIAERIQNTILCKPANFPMFLFREIEYSLTDSRNSYFSFAIHRGELTNPELKQRPANDDESMGDEFNFRFQDKILRKIVHRLNVDVQETRSLNQLLDATEAFKRNFLNVQEEIILILPSYHQPSYLWEQSYLDASERSPDCRIETYSEFSENYAFHFNGIPVFVSTSLTRGILLRRHTLDKLHIGSAPNGKWLLPSYRFANGDRLQIELRLNFELEVSLDDPNAVALVF